MASDRENDEVRSVGNINMPEIPSDIWAQVLFLLTFKLCSASNNTKVLKYIMELTFEEPRYELDQPFVEEPTIRVLNPRYVTDRPLLIKSMDKDARNNIASLRRVNKTLNQLATPILFKYFDASFSASGSDTLENWAARMLEVSQSSVVEEIQCLSIGVKVVWGANWFSAYLFEATFVLPSLVHACKKLTSLEIYGPPFIPGKIDREDQTKGFAKTIENIFRRIAPSNKYCTLQTLHLTLPRVYDFVTLANKSTEHSPKPYRRPLLHFMKDLKHLHLKFTDSSEIFGRYISSAANKRQRTSSNTSLAIDFFHFATLPDLLHSLSMCAAHMHDMDIVDTHNLRSLQVLQLTRIKISPKKLAAISSRNVSTLKSIILSDLELKSGLWESVLLDFCALPSLEDFWINWGGYAKDGTSGHLNPRVPASLWEAGELRTRNEGDYFALATLQRHVNQVRTLAGYDPFDQTEYFYASQFTFRESEASKFLSVSNREKLALQT